MKVDGRHYRTIWPVPGAAAIEVIDQTKLPHRFEVRRIDTLEAAAHAIKSMVVRGAPLIGATAAYGMAIGLAADPSDAGLARTYDTLVVTRPTAINLRWALDRVRGRLAPLASGARFDAAWSLAAEICDEDVEICAAIGRNGLGLIRQAYEKQGGKGPVNVLTHCNAGWLATVDWGTAIAPIYMAHDAGIPVHVWVDETRPRNQGASLTAWELGRHGVPHHIVVDNAGGHLMQHGLVDLCIVGTDRVTAQGDVCNKIGTYLKALAARDNGVPFYVALPSPTIDWTVVNGVREIPIEDRGGAEVTRMSGRLADGSVVEVDIAAPGSPARNDAFDVTPARLVTALVTERGVCAASPEGLRSLFPERKSAAAQ